MNEKLNALKNKVNDPTFRKEVKETVGIVVHGLIVGAVLKVGVFILTEGTKALIEEIGNLSHKSE